MFLSIICTSCKDKEQFVLIGKNTIKKNSFASNVTLKLDNTDNYTFSFISNNKDFPDTLILNGKYSINNDTIYLIDKNEKTTEKAILVGNYIEILDRGLKIKIVENNTSVKPFNRITNHKNYSIFTVSKYYSNKNYKSSEISVEEINSIEKIVNDKIKSEFQIFKIHKNLQNYFIQLIPYFNEQGMKIVWVNCYSKNWLGNQSEEANAIMSGNDAGEYFFDLKINLKTNEIFDFSVNGTN